MFGTKLRSFLPSTDAMAEPVWMQGLHTQLQSVKAAQISPFAEMVKAYSNVRTQLSTSNKSVSTLQKQVDDLSSARATLLEEVSKLQLATKGIVVKSNKERELEEQNTALNKQIKDALTQMSQFLTMQQRLKEVNEENIKLSSAKVSLEQQVSKLTQDAEEREKVVGLLKQEVAALRTENQIQRENDEHTKLENARLLPMIMKAKEREAELMQQILDLEMMVANFNREGSPQPGGGGGPSGGGGGGGSSGGGAHDLQRSQVFTQEAALSGLGGCIMPSYIAHQTEGIHDGDVHALTMTETGRHIL
jgi:molybdopterin converting factor small subunit